MYSQIKTTSCSLILFHTEQFKAFATILRDYVELINVVENDMYTNVIYFSTVVVLPKPKSRLFPRVILIRPGVYDPAVNSVADLMCVLYYLVQVSD